MTTKELANALIYIERHNGLFVTLHENLLLHQPFLKVINIYVKGDQIHITVEPIFENKE